MRRLLPFVVAMSVAVGGRIASADPRRDMAAALAAQADTNPAPAVLPLSSIVVPRTAFGAGRAPTWADVGRRAAEQNGQAVGLARKAADAAAAAAGEAQEKAAKARASKPHTH